MGEMIFPHPTNDSPVTNKCITNTELSADESSSLNYKQYQLNALHTNFRSFSVGNGWTISKEYNDETEHYVSISLPATPVGDNLRSACLVDSGETVFKKAATKHLKHISQSIPKDCVIEEEETLTNFPHDPKLKKLEDKRYDSFRTWSGKLERQITRFRGKPSEATFEGGVGQKAEKEAIPADRFFDALEGPELETLRSSEEIILPEDKKWPFLLRFPISSFGMCLGVGSQAIMWKNLATSESTKFLHISLKVNLVLWCISIALLTLISIYLMKAVLFFEAVRREYYHPIRINFFFAPWITILLLFLGAPPSLADNLHSALWYILMTPILCLNLKIYRQWMLGGDRRLSKVANPSNHLAVVGNFAGAFLGASMGLKEGPLFFFAIGLAHFIVLFVTLYQRHPTNTTLPKDLHPVFFLFVVVPCVASSSWTKIQGSFDNGSRIAYFIAMFLYFSLAVRINFFCGFKFSLAWWAYTIPMTSAAITTIEYANEVESIVTKILVVILTAIATLTVASVIVITILHAFVFRDLFPNDIAIAISDKKPKHLHMKWFHKTIGSPENTNIGNYLKFEAPSFENLDGSQSSLESIGRK